jgi:hypothetical protein
VRASRQAISVPDSRRAVRMPDSRAILPTRRYTRPSESRRVRDSSHFHRRGISVAFGFRFRCDAAKRHQPSRHCHAYLIWQGQLGIRRSRRQIPMRRSVGIR